MTIAAGFRCVDGVLLAADTEITLGGIGKTHRKKIFLIHVNEGCCFTYSGTPDFAKELEAAADIETKTKHGEDLLQAIRRIHQELMQKHFTEPPKNEKTFADLLVTVRVNGRALLYSATGRHFAPVDRYLVFGIGEHLGEALFNTLYHPLMTVEEASFMAIYALRRAKGFVQGVGGKTTLMGVPDSSGGVMFFGEENIKRIEDDFEYFDKEIRPLLFAFANVNLGKKEFSDVLKSTEQLLKNRRDQTLQKILLRPKTPEGTP
jgi:20S proteasome alpha/beta subunit